jgi:LmbE family N-acetylglucosaminyl deacetylase
MLRSVARRDERAGYGVSEDRIMTDHLPASGVTLLGVFAHPDDEQGLGGVFTKAVREGAKAYILCATRGQAGQISDPALATPETLGEVREQELRDAVAVFGWEPPILLDYYDGKVNQSPVETVADDIIRVMRELKPQVVVTFESTGGYGHVDHIAIHHATNLAIEKVNDPGYRPDLGPAHHVDKYYYIAFPRSAMQKFIQSMGEEADFGGDQRTIPLETMGIPDELISTVVDVREFRDVRVRGMAAHRTQFSVEELERFNSSETEDLFGRAHFMRIIPAPVPGTPFPDETDMLAGII